MTYEIASALKILQEHHQFASRPTNLNHTVVDLVRSAQDTDDRAGRNTYRNLLVFRQRFHAESFEVQSEGLARPHGTDFKMRTAKRHVTNFCGFVYLFGKSQRAKRLRPADTETGAAAATLPVAE